MREGKVAIESRRRLRVRGIQVDGVTGSRRGKGNRRERRDPSVGRRRGVFRRDELRRNRGKILVHVLRRRLEALADLRREVALLLQGGNQEEEEEEGGSHRQSTRNLRRDKLLLVMLRRSGTW